MIPSPIENAITHARDAPDDDQTGSTCAMSGLPKLRVEFEIYADSWAMLQEIQKRYALPDQSKALRCLLDYAATDGDWDEIFKRVRCRRC
jgi:hypothetical protein